MTWQWNSFLSQKYFCVTFLFPHKYMRVDEKKSDKDKNGKEIPLFEYIYL